MKGIDPLVGLRFDPRDGSTEIQEIFADDLARTLWLGIKQGHVTTNNFNEDCLCYAEFIRRNLEKEGQEWLTAEKLCWILSAGYAPPGKGIIGGSETDFAAEFLPFVLGEKIIRFEVLPPKVSECKAPA